MTGARRRPLVSGNWKMHHDHLAAIRTMADLGLRLDAEDAARVDVSVHPPFTDLRSAQTVMEDRSVPVFLGAQHCHHRDEGAFTGEIAPPMLARLGVSYVIVGHSERRQHFGQSDEDVARTLRAVQRHGMTPIICVGETGEEREQGATEERLTAQVTASLGSAGGLTASAIVVAYEPIWAIGTGKTATAADAQQACAHIRAVAAGCIGQEAADQMRVQYGGSVKPESTSELLACPDVDGVLVGGASLDAASFADIVHAAASGAPRR